MVTAEAVITKKNVVDDILYKPLIGRDIEIVESKNKNEVGMKGKIVFESSNFFFLDQEGSTARILKRNIVFNVYHRGKALNIDGRLLVNTVIHRLKKIK